MAEPGSQEMRDKLKSQMGATVTPITNGLTEKIESTLNSYKSQTGLFSKGQFYHQKNPTFIAEHIKKRMSQTNPTKHGLAVVDAFEQLARDNQKPSIVDQIGSFAVDVGHHAYDQFLVGPNAAAAESTQGIGNVAESVIKGYTKMHGNMFPFNMLKNAGIDVNEDGVQYLEVPKVPQPTTTGGEITKGLSQAGLSYAVGERIFKPVQALSKALPQLKTWINTPGMKGVINTAVGEAATLEGKDRFSRFLNETFGVDGNKVVMYLADSKDENEFEKRLKSGLDGVLSAVGMGALIPVIIPIGKAFYKAGYFFSKTKDPKGAEREIDNAMSYLEKVQKLYPERIVKEKKSGDPLVSIKKGVQEPIEEVSEEQPTPARTVEEYEENLEQADVLTQPDEVVVPQGKKGGEPLRKPAPIQPEDIELSDLDIYKNQQNIPLDSTLADFNMERMDAEDSVLEIIQKGAVAIREKLPNSKSYGPSGKAKKIEEINELGEKTERYVTEGDNVISFEEIRDAADGAKEQLKRMGIPMERFIAGTKATTEELPHLVLATRDYVIDMATKVRNEGRVIDDLSQQKKEISNERLVRYHRSMVRFMNTLAEVKGIKRDIARTMAALNIDAVSGNQKDKLVDGILADAGNTDVLEQVFGKDGSATSRGRRNILRLASHMANMEYAEEIVSIGNKDSMTRVFDVINYLGVNNFLSNFSTQTVNLMGSLAMTNLLTSEKFIAAGAGSIENFGRRKLGLNEVQGVTFNEATAHTFGVTQALTEMFLLDKAMFDRSALGQAKKGFVDLDSGFSSHDLSAKNAADPERFMEYPDLNIQGLSVPEAFSSKSIGQIFGAEDGNMPQFLKEVINGSGVMLGMPGRMLMGGDRFFRAINYRSAIHALAMRKASGEGLSGKALQDRYMDLIINLPKEIDDTAQMYAQVSLFQEEIGRDGLEKYVRMIEKARNTPLPAGDRDWLLSFSQNAQSSFINSKIPFFRTPYNIFKQTLVQRNPVVIALRLGLDKDYRKKFKTDAAFRQDIIAKFTTGSMLNYLGYSLGKGMTIGDYNVKAEGASAPEPLARDVAQDQGRRQPEILIRNMSNAEAFTVPIGRADPIATFIQTGSILGNYQAYERNHIEPYRKEKLNDKANEKLKKIEDRLIWQLGNLFLDKAMLRGVKDVITKTVPGASPSGTDYGGLARDYITDYAGGMPLGNFARGTQRAVTNQPVMTETRAKEVLVPKRKGDRNITDSGAIFNNLSEQKVKELGQVDRLLTQWAEEWRKVNLIGIEEVNPDVEGMVKNPVKIKAGAVPMLDLEGNPMGFTEKEAGLYERWLEQNLIPFTTRKVNETNTSVLISELDISTTHPKRWTSIVVKGRKIPITTEQQMVWAAVYGGLNKKVFANYNKVVKQLKLEGGQSLSPKKRAALETFVSQTLKANKESSKFIMMSKFSNMKEKTGLIPQFSELQAKGS